jgi:hypothetical protein
MVGDRRARSDQSPLVTSRPVGGGVNTLAGGGTTDLGSLYQAALTISGTATITSFGSTAPVGVVKFLTFSGASVLTHSATALILPTLANITTAAGDTCIIQCISSGNWRVLSYQLASGAALSSSANFLGAVNFAGVISPTTLAANTNNWAPTGFSTSEYIRASASTPGFNVTGLAGGSAGLQKTVVNVGSFNITLTSNDANSSTGNLFLMPFPIVLVPGASIQLRYDATGSGGWRPVGSTNARTISGAFRNLKIVNDSGAPTTTMDITADALTLEDAFGNAYRALGVSVAPVMTAGGINGLDTGSIVNNIITWYAEYVIYNPATNTVAGLYSLSASAATLLASGNMPAGYTFAALVGWVRTDGAATARWMRMLQYGRNWRWVMVASSNTTQYPQIVSAAQTSYTAASIANFVPPGSVSIDFNASCSTNVSAYGVSPNPNFTTAGVYATSTQFQVINSAATVVILPGRVMLESLNLYYYSSTGTLTVLSVGGELNI